MDARITKQRLGNMLSYDWLKIACTIAAVIAALVLFFTMVGLKPARAQKFYVHLYGALNFGGDYTDFTDELDDLLSYDVLDVRVENFGNDFMAGASYSARRSSGEGSVAFAADYTSEEGGITPFADLITMGMTHPGEAEESLNMFWCMDKYFAELDSYLARFFGEEWRTAPVYNADEAELCFRARNVEGPNNMNRFRSESQIAEGLKEERVRLETLRSDYLWLLDPAKGGLGTSKLPYAEYRSEVTLDDGSTQTNVYQAGVSLGGLTDIDRFISYSTADGGVGREKLNFLIYYNGKSDFDDGTNDGREDLKYEAVTLLKYIAEKYA